ncbi:type IV toxin-antitoxin system AbiEi family antitoxin domain-containing protein [Knoellia locipacati]|uniref:DUF559 domain-containing protein n=1 Tax=Knoellia locipacati TaxID=882824 RepID=A0A512T1Z8_9MICO|nr:hypothetical protein KLO01_22920 [Knoellia locipacati]
MRWTLARELASLHDGVVDRATLRRAGIDRAAVRTEVRAGRWLTHGRHTVSVTTSPLTGRAPLWQAVWESGSGAALDGAAALLAAGMRGFAPRAIDVSQPRNNRHHAVAGVRLHRRAVMPPLAGAGLPRVVPEVAAVHAALWARSDREAALILCLVVQQRLTTTERLLVAWRSARSAGPRRPFLADAVTDICDGAQALGELDFARLCRREGLPPPTRQVVRHGRNGRIYLDAAWGAIGLVVEIDGGHHQWALNPVEDALRQNDVVVAGEVMLRVPLLGLRLEAKRFLRQVAVAYALLSGRRTA